MNDIYRSATFKLTAWYLALVMAISLVFSVVVYRVGTDTLAQGLINQQARIYKAFPVFNGNPFFTRDNDVTNGSHILLENLIYFNVAVFIGAGFASYWLARRTLQPIEQSNERQRRFVADASHELRTPLTALKMSIEVALMDSGASKEELRDALQSSLEEADKLNVLLNNLLRLSQLESQEIRHSFTALHVTDLVDNAILQTAQQAEAKHITVTPQASDSVISGDRESLVQALVILLDNAIKYSPNHSSITIHTEHADHVTTIIIQDHGVGIDRAALEHVFDRFYRANKARSGNEGFGLGLSIAKHIADLHEGTITLTSRVGKGTTARLMLPTISTTSEH